MNATDRNINFVFNNICEKKHVNIAYSERADFLYVNRTTGHLIEWPKINILQRDLSSQMSYPWEILNAFFEKNSIQPHWFDVGEGVEARSIFNATGDGKWWGGTGMIQRDEVDFRAAQVMDGYSIVEFGKCCHISPAIRNIKYHWFSRLPQELSPTWNLLYLFPKEIKAHNYQNTRIATWLPLCLLIIKF